MIININTLIIHWWARKLEFWSYLTTTLETFTFYRKYWRRSSKGSQSLQSLRVRTHERLHRRVCETCHYSQSLVCKPDLNNLYKQCLKVNVWIRLCYVEEQLREVYDVQATLISNSYWMYMYLCIWSWFVISNAYTIRWKWPLCKKWQILKSKGHLLLQIYNYTIINVL